MRSSLRRRLGTFAVTAASALTLLATTAAVALATVPGGLVDGQGQNIGRGGVFTVTTLSGWSSLEIVGGIAISLAAMALVTWLGISSYRRAGTRLQLAPSGSSTEDLPARTADQERKAA